MSAMCLRLLDHCSIFLQGTARNCLDFWEKKVATKPYKTTINNIQQNKMDHNKLQEKYDKRNRKKSQRHHKKNQH